MMTCHHDLTVELQRRDFSGPVDPDLRPFPLRLSWSAFGGPDTAELRISGPAENLMDHAGLLRCGVVVRDQNGAPVWWGYVNAVEVVLGAARVRVSMDDLANKVSVQYSLISPTNQLGDECKTDPASDAASQREYGTKELLIVRDKMEENFAEQLRDTVLAQRSWPVSTLGRRNSTGNSYVILHCAGWFQTLAWTCYEYLEGFYANQGPGPGSFIFGETTSNRLVSQKVFIGTTVNLKYVYFMLRNIGATTRSIRAELRSNTSGGTPGAVITASQLVDPSGLSPDHYDWVKFEFAAPVTLTAGFYWIGVHPGGESITQYFQLRTDENQGYLPGHLRYYSTNWIIVPSTTNLGGLPDAYFRAVCVQDTGDQLSDIAAAGGQFFQRITTISTGVDTTPYRANGLTCLAEVQNLLHLGTSGQRLILASVTPERHLSFREQPDPDLADVYLDREGIFYTREGVPLRPWKPPVGRYARLAGSNRVNLPWDRRRMPACFVAGADYWPLSGRVRVKTLERGNLR